MTVPTNVPDEFKLFIFGGFAIIVLVTVALVSYGNWKAKRQTPPAGKRSNKRTRKVHSK